MLKHLTIKNYALIRHLDIDFHQGFSVMTGETGAGKSIILGALGLIIGKRADTQVMLEKDKKCIVEGTFSIREYGLLPFFRDNNLDFEENTILRREIGVSGKSRAFINDTPVNLNLLKQLGDRLIDIHSQHNTITLNDSNFQLAVIDDFISHPELLTEYRSKYDNYLELKKKLAQLLENETRFKADQDYFQFQFDELEKAGLEDDEQEELEKELELLDNTELIKSSLVLSTQLLQEEDGNIVEKLNEVETSLRGLIKFHDRIQELQQRIESNLIDLKDISAELQSIEENVNYDPQRIQELKNRLDLIYHLQQKHRVNSVHELIAVRDRINEKLQSIYSMDDEIEQTRKSLDQSEQSLNKIASKIADNRKKAIPVFEQNITAILKELGMPEAQFKVELLSLDNYTRDGLDKIIFLFNANRGGTPDEVSRIASGGELSRLMLSIKSLISGRNLLPTIIFDEIDMGVSGDIANKVGNILLNISENMQVMAITHLPQIAGKGDTHYRVYKQNHLDKTISEINIIDGDDRINEIAKMLSGEKISRVAVENARELLHEKN